MSTTTNEAAAGVTAAVNEAARITREAASRGTATAKASIDAAGSYVDNANVLGHQLFTTWSAQSEAILKAAFEAENAAVDAGLGLFDLGVSSNRQVLDQFSQLVRQTQGATIESWRAAVKAAEKAFEPPAR